MYTLFHQVLIKSDGQIDGPVWIGTNHSAMWALFESFEVSKVEMWQ
jgi:hypothetical protein